jgi:NAD-dependent dihydropyrimidine dehydrogenase PreA subunit
MPYRLTISRPKTLEQAEKYLERLKGNVDMHTWRTICHGYEAGRLPDKGLEDLTDQDLLALRNCGPATLAAFRRVITLRPESCILCPLMGDTCDAKVIFERLEWLQTLGCCTDPNCAAGNAIEVAKKEFVKEDK